MVTALVSVIWLGLALPGSLKYASSAHVSLTPALVAVGKALPTAWDLLLVVPLWLLAPRIGGRIFSDRESRFEAPDTRGWLATAALLVGLRLVFAALPGLCVAGIALHKLGTSLFMSTALREDMLDTTSYLSASVARFVVGLLLVLLAARLAARLDRRKGVSDGTSDDAAVLGIRPLALYFGYWAMSAILTSIQPAWLQYAMRGRLSPFDWTDPLIAGAACLAQVIPALLMWRFAGPVSTLINRGCWADEPEEQGPLESM